MAAHTAELKYVCALFFPLMNPLPITASTWLYIILLLQQNTVYCPFCWLFLYSWTTNHFIFSVAKNIIFLDCILEMHQTSRDTLSIQAEAQMFI